MSDKYQNYIYIALYYSMYECQSDRARKKQEPSRVVVVLATRGKYEKNPGRRVHYLPTTASPSTYYTSSSKDAQTFKSNKRRTTQVTKYGYCH